MDPTDKSKTIMHRELRQDEMPERPGMQNRNKRSSNKTAPASSNREDNRGVQQVGFLRLEFLKQANETFSGLLKIRN
jgi:hypothetical protein